LPISEALPQHALKNVRAAHRPIGRREAWALGLLGLLLLVLRGCYIYSYPWNSDESQHLHVVWAWANGLLPYRDIFDNHTPLFHLLCAPLFAVLGERADIVEPMRWAMAPLFALSLWCIYRLGKTAFSPRIGLWAAALAGFCPRFFSKMGEFRTDVLWTVLWLLALVILTSGPLTRKRLFFTGLTMGAAFSVSMKTILLLLTAGSASAITWLAWKYFARKTGERHPLREFPFQALSFLLGMAILPAALLLFFASKGALGRLYYCVIRHNTMPGVAPVIPMGERLAYFGALAFLSIAALVAVRRFGFGHCS
jgi:hypothetical protein